MSASDVAKLQGSRKSGKDKWSKALKEGYTVARIGPPWVKGGEFWKDRFFHGGMKIDGKIIKVYCAKNDVDKKTGKTRKCTVCRTQKELKGDKSKFAQSLYPMIMQKSESLWNFLFADAYVSDSGKVEIKGLKEPKFRIQQLSNFATDGMLDIFAEEEYRKDSDLGVTDPKVGRWIRIKRIGTDRDTEYKFKALEPEKLHDREELLKTLVNLDDIVRGSSDEELEGFLETMKKKAKEKAKKEDKKNKKSASASGSGSGSKSSSKSSASKSKSKSGSSSSSTSKSGSKSGSGSSEAKAVLKEMKESMKGSKNKKGSSSASGSKSGSKSSSSKSKSGSSSSSSSSDSKSKE